jgi:trk system potassium uptake protein
MGARMPAARIIDLRAVAGVLGALLFFLGAAMLLPAAVALLYREPGWLSFGSAALAGMAAGGAAWYFLKPRQELRIREGFAIVALAWFVLSLLGAVPFVTGGVLPSYTDAFFETMSGLTTTGATILGGAMTPAIEDIPRAFLFWRSLTQWLGGMGIIVLTLAVLPLLGVGGMQLFRAEVSGPTVDKLTPRVTDTARRLWMIYIGFTALQAALLLPAMGAFDAVNHAFTTMATGGYSTRNGSVGDFGSAYVEWVIVLFMFLAGVSFALHYRLFRGEGLGILQNRELRLYMGLIAGAVALVFWSIFGGTGGTLPGDEVAFVPYESALDALRTAAFQVVSIMTTTGYGTADYALWPPLAVGVIFALFFVGGMAGSTGGGVKVIRHLILFKSSARDLKQLLHPQAVMPLRVNGRVIAPDIVSNVLSFIALYFGLIFVGTLVMTLAGLDLMSAFSASFSATGNVGPGFGSVGPVENYAHIPGFGKWALAMLMMAGRLEIFTVLVLFVPAFWRK